jgi:putative transposase
MDEGHLVAAVRYVSLNPVRARLAARAQDWPWSSVGAHLRREDDGLVSVAPVLARIADFPNLIADEGDAGFAALRTAESTGRPLGNEEFVTALERILGRRIAKRAPGRKPKIRDDGQMPLL